LLMSVAFLIFLLLLFLAWVQLITPCTHPYVTSFGWETVTWRCVRHSGLHTHSLKSLVDFELCLPGLFSAFVSKLVGMANVHVHFTLFLSLVFDLMSDLVIDLCISA
jgi:hypothetical protein